MSSHVSALVQPGYAVAVAIVVEVMVVVVVVVVVEVTVVVVVPVTGMVAVRFITMLEVDVTELDNC